MLFTWRASRIIDYIGARWLQLYCTKESFGLFTSSSFELRVDVFVNVWLLILDTGLWMPALSAGSVRNCRISFFPRADFIHIPDVVIFLSLFMSHLGYSSSLSFRTEVFYSFVCFVFIIIQFNR